MRLGWLGVLAAMLGCVWAARSDWYREHRLRGLDEPALQRWVESRPDDALGHFYLAMTLGRSGHPREAARELSSALERDPALSRARWRLARLMAIAGQEDDAESLLQQGVRITPGDGKLHAELGRLDEERQAFRLAAREWEKAAALAPKDADVWYHLGRCWMRLSDDPRALAGYRRATALAPDSPSYEKALAGALRLARLYPEAEQHCRRALQLAPDDPDAQFELAKLLWDRDGATPEVEERIRRAISLQPDSPLLHYSLASVCQQQGRLEAAAREYRATLRLLEAQEPPAAEAPWAQREQWLESMEGPLFNLARLSRQLGHSGEAARYLDRFQRMSEYRNGVHQLLIRLANRPDDSALHFELARLHAAAGAVRLAEEQYRAGSRLASEARPRAGLMIPDPR